MNGTLLRRKFQPPHLIDVATMHRKRLNSENADS